MKVIIAANVHVAPKDKAALVNAEAEQVLATARMQGAKVTVTVEPDRKVKKTKTTVVEEKVAEESSDEATETS